MPSFVRRPKPLSWLYYYANRAKMAYEFCFFEELLLAEAEEPLDILKQKFLSENNRIKKALQDLICTNLPNEQVANIVNIHLSAFERLWEKADRLDSPEKSDFLKVMLTDLLVGWESNLSSLGRWLGEVPRFRAEDLKQELLAQIGEIQSELRKFEEENFFLEFCHFMCCKLTTGQQRLTYRDYWHCKKMVINILVFFRFCWGSSDWGSGVFVS